MKKFQVLLILAMAFSLICQTVGEDPSSEEKNNNKKRAISYQSLIKDVDGNLIVDGKYLITFRLYDSETAEDAIWFENQNIAIKDGVLNALIGNKKRLEPSHFIDELWLTLEINKIESDKQYIGAASYSMYAGLVDIDGFVAGDNVGLTKDPDGRIVIDVITPSNTDNIITSSLTFGASLPDPANPDNDYFQYLTMNNQDGTPIGSFMHNLASNWYKGGSDFDDIYGYDDFVIYAKNGRDLVLKSDPSTTGSAGDVFIGTEATPNDLTVTRDLNVTGSLNVNEGLFSDNLNLSGNLTSTSITSKYMSLGINTDTSFDLLHILNKEGTAIGTFMYNKSEIGSNWYRGGNEFDDFVIYARGGRDLVLKSDKTNGDVYIGAATCANNLRVTGILYATEVNVKLDIFPDYVFKDDYNLLSLSQVEEHINSHGYLPGMPSEKEVVENGLNLNEMHLKLVEKIEELTLHMIRLEKENKELRNKIDSVIQ